MPPNTEEYKNGLKIVTEYGLDDDNRKFKVVRTYKIEKRYVAKAIAQRKSWPKFGLSKEDKPGPNPATTIVSEDVAMQVFLFSVYISKPMDVNYHFYFDSLLRTKRILIIRKMTLL